MSDGAISHRSLSVLFKVDKAMKVLGLATFEQKNKSLVISSCKIYKIIPLLGVVPLPELGDQGSTKISYSLKLLVNFHFLLSVLNVELTVISR